MGSTVTQHPFQLQDHLQDELQELYAACTESGRAKSRVAETRASRRWLAEVAVCGRSPQR